MLIPKRVEHRRIQKGRAKPGENKSFHPLYVNQFTMLTLTLVGDSDLDGVNNSKLIEFIDILREEIYGRGLRRYIFTDYPRDVRYYGERWKEHFTYFNEKYDFAEMDMPSRMEFIARVIRSFRNQLMHTYNINSEDALDIIICSLKSFYNKDQKTPQLRPVDAQK